MGMILHVCWVFNLAAQNPLFTVHHSVSLKRDSLPKQEVLARLGSFLEHLNGYKKDTADTHLQQLSTAALAEEMNDSGITWQVINLVRLNDSIYLIKVLAFKPSGISGSFELIALKRMAGFCIQSPLWWKTRNWKQQYMQGVQFYFASEFNRSKAKQFAQIFRRFNHIMGADYRQILFVCCDDLNEALQMVGVHYKASLAGYKSGSISQKGNACLFIADGNYTSGFKAYDPHDFWHYCLYKWKPRSTWNKPVDEGCAYLYGGSWGLSWKEILQQFHRFADTTTNNNWLELYEKPFEFTGTKDKPLYVAYVLNALIIQSMQSDHGLTGIRELLASGSGQNGKEHYFRILETRTGINRMNFNSRMNDLIDKSR
jgi:hypothetical protein